jgi:predicted transposase YdaD
MGWLTQPIFEQGLAAGRTEGRAEGRQAGRAEGQAKSLIRLLQKRFGDVPAHIHEQVFAADVQSLDTWFERALEVRDLQSVFSVPLRPRV